MKRYVNRKIVITSCAKGEEESRLSALSRFPKPTRVSA